MKLDSLEKTVTPSVFILRLDRTVSLYVTVMLQTVIMLKAVYSLTGVCTRILINNEIKNMNILKFIKKSQILSRISHNIFAVAIVHI